MNKKYFNNERKSLIKQIKQARISSEQVGIWWIGQAGYVIKTSHNKIIFIDPYLSGAMEGNPESFPRLVPPPLNPEEIEADLYLCTHNHSDHTDLDSIVKIKNKEKIIFVAPKSSAKALRKIGIEDKQIKETCVGECTELKRITIRATFCIPTDEGVIDSIGFLIQLENGITLYHTGDTGFHNFLFYLSKYLIDVMFVCINGKYGNMGIEEAVQLTRYLRPKVVIPNHYGMFAINSADPYEFRGQLIGSSTEAQCKILEIGERYIYQKK